jgi:hypothetical protein
MIIYIIDGVSSGFGPGNPDADGLIRVQMDGIATKQKRVSGALVSTMFNPSMRLIFTDDATTFLGNIFARMLANPLKFFRDKATPPEPDTVSELIRKKKSSSINENNILSLFLSQIPNISYGIAQAITKVYGNMGRLVHEMTAIETVSLMEKKLALIPVTEKRNVGKKTASSIIRHLGLGVVHETIS